MKRMLLAAGAIVVPAVLVLSGSTPALATTVTATYAVTKNTTRYDGTSHTITVGGSNIYFKKTDGPHVLVAWVKCLDHSVRGPWVDFEDSDPTARRILDNDFLVNTKFCLMFYSEGNNTNNTVTGPVYYNVFS